MRIIRDTAFLTPDDRGAVVAIGNFDGVHLGHKVVIDLAQEKARLLRAPSGVMTFEPHPRAYFTTITGKDILPFRLMSSDAKAHRLEKLNLDLLFELTFNASLADLEPDTFAREILANQMGLRHVVVGADFRFGKKRAGRAEDLVGLGEKFGFGATVAPLLELSAGEVSSTAIREALSHGRPQDAARMLGHFHRIDGTVIRGDQRGRDLGFPTANMSISGLHPPKFGVYAVKIDVLEGPNKGNYLGAASIGVRPTFGENHPNCETYIFDFKGDIYGAEVSVALVDYLREEEKFDSLEALISQMDADCAKARRILRNV